LGEAAGAHLYPTTDCNNNNHAVRKDVQCNSQAIAQTYNLVKCCMMHFIGLGSAGCACNQNVRSDCPEPSIWHRISFKCKGTRWSKEYWQNAFTPSLMCTGKRQIQ